MKKRKFINKIFSAVMALAVTVGAFGSTVNAVLSSDVLATSSGQAVSNAEKTDFKYVALGASGVSGYGLKDYTAGGASVLEKDGLYGYKTDVDGSYPSLIAEKLSESHNVDLALIAISSMRAEELRFLLDESYLGDYYTDAWFYDTDGDGKSENMSLGAALYEWQKLAAEGASGYNHNPTNAEALAALRGATLSAVSAADLITIDVGMNNFGAYVLEAMLGGSFEGNLDAIATDLSEYFDTAKGFALDIINDNLDGGELPENILNSFVDNLAYALAGYCLNLDAIVEKICELNPEAKIVVVGAQNIMRGVDIVVPGYEDTVPFGDVFGFMVNAANLYTATLSSYSDKYYFANVSNNGHVESLLDEITAYNGSPATISDSVKASFNGYDASMLLETWVGQLFAVNMSESGFVKLDASQKDLFSEESLEAFYYGFHYDLAENGYPAVTLADGTPLKDFIKAGEENKHTGKNKVNYDAYTRMLNVAYDVLAESLKAAVSRDTIDLSAMSLAEALGASAIGTLKNVFRTVLVEAVADSNYVFDINERYPDGFFATMAKQYGAQEDMLVSLFAYAAHLSFGSAVLSHPNENGHKEIADTVWAAYTKGITGKEVIADQIGIYYDTSEDSSYVAVSNQYADYAKDFAEAIGLSAGQLDYTTLDNIDYGKIDRADLVSIYVGDSDAIGFTLDQMLAYIRNCVDDDIRNSLLDYISGVVDNLKKDNPYFGLVANGVKNTANKEINKIVNGVVGLDMLNGKVMQELDWSLIVDEETVSEIDEMRGELKNAIVTAIGYDKYSYTLNMAEMINVSNLQDALGEFTIEIPVADGIVFAVESYFYQFVKYFKASSELIEYINDNNPDAKIVVFGKFNPMKGTYVEFGEFLSKFMKELSDSGALNSSLMGDLGNIEFGEGGSKTEIGQFVEYFALATSATSIMQYSTSENSTFVYLFDAKSEYDVMLENGEMDADLFTLLSAYSNDKSLFNISEESNLYVVEQMLYYVRDHWDNHKYSGVCDTSCNRCGEEREVPHSYPYCDDAYCAICGYEREPLSHVHSGCVSNICLICGVDLPVADHTFGEWYVAKAAEEGVDGEECRACTVCGYTELKIIPALPLPAPTNKYLAVIIIGAIAVVGIALVCIFLFARKKPTSPTSEVADTSEPAETEHGTAESDNAEPDGESTSVEDGAQEQGQDDGAAE